MPLSIVGELVVSVVGEMLAGLGGEGVKALARRFREARERSQERARANALAMADIVVLAACHDFTVTEAERTQLADELLPLFEELGIEAGVEELLDRWSGPRRALQSDSAFVTAVRSVGHDLGQKEREATFRSVVAVLRADDAHGELTPFRRRSTTSPARAIGLFAEALGVDPET